MTVGICDMPQTADTATGTHIVYIGHSLMWGMAEVSFRLDGRLFSYELDWILLEHIKRLASHNPGRAFNFAKKRGRLVTNDEDDA
ncbi:MAG: hypothetical protein KAU50_06710 [Candidatus Marinimicrobia bacterium]|nr:hypothetical protein [Candidatus Neomarinimicrobiota bacterium]